MKLQKYKSSFLFGEELFRIVDPRPEAEPLKIDFDIFSNCKYRVFENSGGGIKGVIDCVKLMATEAHFKKTYNKSMFDFITNFWGTSTGSVISGGSSIKIPIIEEAIFYITKGPQIFKEKSFLGSLLSTSWYDNSELIKVLTKFFGNTTFKQRYEKYGTELTISSYSKLENETLFFNHIDFPDMMLREAILCSCSAPGYFPVRRVGMRLLQDGGTTGIYNCMLEKALDDVLYDKKADPKECYIISMGTGMPLNKPKVTEEVIKKSQKDGKIKALLNGAVLGGRLEATKKQVKKFVHLKEELGINGFRWDIKIPGDLDAMDKTDNIDELVKYVEQGNGAQEVYF
jgi:hypothetical protein